MKKTLITLLILLVSLSIFAAGGKEETKTAYTFAADATWPPLEFVDDAGNLTGFEVELMPLIGSKVGVEMSVKNIAWDGIFAGLLNGQYDGIASGVTITEERKATMLFSEPILSAGQVVIVKSTDADTYKDGISSLKGKKVGVQIGTTGDITLSDNQDKYGVVVKQYDDIGLAIQDMLNGNLDAAVCDSLIASDFVLANENYKGVLTTVGGTFTSEDIAIAVKKDNTALMELINKGLAAAKADGSFDALKAKWNLL